MDENNYLDELRARIERQYEAAINAIETERRKKLDALQELSKPFASGPLPSVGAIPAGQETLTAFAHPKEENKAAKCRKALAAIDGVVNVRTMREKIESLYGREVANDLSNTIRTFLWTSAKQGRLSELPNEHGQMKDYTKSPKK